MYFISPRNAASQRWWLFIRNTLSLNELNNISSLLSNLHSSPFSSNSSLYFWFVVVVLTLPQIVGSCQLVVEYSKERLFYNIFLLNLDTIFFIRDYCWILNAYKYISFAIIYSISLILCDTGILDHYYSLHLASDSLK